MNALNLMNKGMIRTNPLSDAQFLMAKAYRGVPYVDAHHDHPASRSETRRLTYRGVPYTPADPVTVVSGDRTRQFVYRGSAYQG